MMLVNRPTKSAVGSYSGVLSLDCVKNPRNVLSSTDSTRTVQKIDDQYHLNYRDYRHAGIGC